MASSKQFKTRSATLTQKLQEIRRNPSAISALASLGLHGLLFTIFPFLPDTALKATEPEIQRSVDIVELTPQEQQRLPDFSTTVPPIELPPITQAPQPNNSDLFSLTDPPQPPSSDLPSDDSLLAPPLPIFIPPLPPPTQIPSFSIQIPPTPAQPAPIRPSPSPQATNSPQSSPSPTATPAEPLPSVAVEQGPETSQPQASTEQPSPAPRTEEQIRQDLVARQQELRELYTYNSTGTSEGDGQIAFLTWFREAFGKDFGEGDSKPALKETTAEYPRQACLLKQTRRAVVGVVVDAENQIISEPKVLQSSGYRLFNQEALKVVESYAFENSTGKEQPYLIGVKFEYNEETCPAGLTPIEPAG